MFTSAIPGPCDRRNRHPNILHNFTSHPETCEACGKVFRKKHTCFGAHKCEACGKVFKKKHTCFGAGHRRPLLASSNDESAYTNMSVDIDSQVKNLQQFPFQLLSVDLRYVLLPSRKAIAHNYNKNDDTPSIPS